MTTTPPDPRRDTVRQLAGQGISNREIARRTRVSEATVRRWLRDAPPTPGDAPADAPATQHDAPTDALVIPLDDDLRAHLDLLADAGLDPTDAVRFALSLTADAVRGAWDYGTVPHGAPMTVKATAVPAEPPVSDPRRSVTRPATAGTTTTERPP